MAQNERYVVVLKVTQTTSWPSRVAVTDLLPAGFEIDNPRLVQSADLAKFDWLPEITPAHLEFRDDRFVVALDRNPEETARVHPRLCRAGGDAGHLRPSAGDRRGHVPAAALGPHRDRQNGGHGTDAVSRRSIRRWAAGAAVLALIVLGLDLADRAFPPPLPKAAGLSRW